MTASPTRPPIWLLLLFGVFTGMVSGFFGIGGGILIVPLLIFGFGLERPLAGGTSLGVVVFVAGTGALFDFVYGDPTARPALMAAALVLPGSILASRFAARFVSRLSTTFLRRLFAAVLLLAGVRLMNLVSLGAGAGGFHYETFDPWLWAVLPLLGVFVGTVSALVGIGGGVLLVPALAFVFADLEIIRCRATSLIVVVPTALSGLIAHLKYGTADLAFVRPLVPACVVGSILGSWLVHEAPPEILRQVFGGFLAVVAGVICFVPDPRRRPRESTRGLEGVSHQD